MPSTFEQGSIAARKAGVKSPERSSPSWQTPLYQQYWKIKDGVPNTVLFFRLGDFYELFGDDALLAAPIMQVQVTSRNKSEDEIPMCGVPYHAWENYADRLLSSGLSIAIADQLEEAGAGKKLVERGVVRILTPGLPIDPTKLNSKNYHYLAVISQSESFEIVLFDFLARRLYQGEFKNNEELAEILNRTEPREILLSSEIAAENLPALSRHEKKILSWGRGTALSILKDYLSYTQRWEQAQVDAYLPVTQSLSEFHSNTEEVALSMQVREQWDIHPHLENLLDECGSAGGSRELREILSRPLLKSERIRARQELLKYIPVKNFLELTKELYDLERLVGRILIRASKPYELLRVRDSLQVLRKIDDFFKGEWSKYYLGLKDFEKLPDWKTLSPSLLALEALFTKTLSHEATVQSTARDLIQSGVDATYDSLKNLYGNLEGWLESFEEKLKAETGINNLKLRFNRVAGFYIEVSKAQSAKVPSSFERRQTLVNAERYTVPELKEREEEILGAEDKLERRSAEILESLSEELRKTAEVLLSASKVISFLDALCGADRAIQKLSAYGTWSQPKLEDGPFSFEIREGRHPIIEATQRSFVSNSLTLGRGKKRILLLTGPNMAGKSTLMRQTGLILILAQVGLRVPAESCELSPARGFYSRMGASDKILLGDSTFMVEMKEMAHLLREANENSFVLMDEVGRGTSTKDGLALAKAFLEYFAETMPALTLFATHYHELAPFSEDYENVLNASMSIKEWKSELIFLRKLIPEAASSSYGLHVAKLAGIHPKILNRARSFHSQNAPDREAAPLLEMPLFSKPFPLLQSAKQSEEKLLEIDTNLKVNPPEDFWSDRMKSINLDELSPKEAWNLLENWKAESDAMREGRECEKRPKGSTNLAAFKEEV